ncbi:hypothetical protein D187_000812 [Cystobacter fuscus DSM 2262]|uniref:Uncharacterized protein n=1 Tax=Cystobacter fuscus (strain ATCC 25194 / DSM 2262 / NBRC 100088 / M29) TaxID=1242864 RepID=S9PQS0_CYSF2|nr:hypothetical protein D187_000812 [Cystobacter fuscus DSM 2262]
MWSAGQTLPTRARRFGVPAKTSSRSKEFPRGSNRILHDTPRESCATGT